jgi:type II secretory pathway pseudopilin PulG
LLLNLDPNKAFDDQLDGLSPHVQERLRSSGALTATANADASELTNQVYQAYIKQKELFDKFLQEDQLGITNVVKEKEKGMVDRNGMEPVPGEKKKRKLRIKKKFKRIVKVGGGIGNKFQKDNQTEAEGSDSEEEIEITESNDEDEANIVAIGPGGPMQLQPLPSAGLRRARRPNARRPGAQRGQRRSPPDKGVIQTNEETESPKSSISPSPNGRGGKRPISSQKMDQLMSSPAQPLDLDEGGRVERQTPGAVRQRKAAASAMRNRQSRQKKQTAAAAAAAVARNRQDQSSQRSILKSSSTSSPSNAAAAPPPPAITSQRSILKKQGSNHSIEPTPDSIPSTIQPPVQNLHASHTSVMSRLSGVTQTVVVEPEYANQEQTTVALDVANSKQVLSELRLAKEELDQAQLLLSSAKEREKDLQKANTEKDRKISKLLKTVAGLQQTVKELSVTKVPSPPSSRSPRMEEIATPRGSLRNRHAFALKQQLLGKDNVYCYYCCCYSCHCTVLKVPELPMLSKQGRDSKAPPSLNLEESSPWDEMKSRKRRSSGPPKISAYLGSGKQNGEGVAYEPHNDARPLTKDKKSQMSSLSLEPPGPPTILREEQLPTSSPFDIPNTNSSSPPRSVDLASNVREITPDNRRRIKSPQPGQEKKAAGIVVDITSVKSATESERISDKKRKKRELEEQLRHSQELEALRTASGGMEREMRSDSSEDEEEI